ncbi:NUDIX hydrolase YfcD [Permianibacter sp. IMCC34836]|uniref:NUDIX hydrolase YfcD n=1 Tax=Permianibacter fluminis TaxID=2738515 RepID=UPI001555CEBD|nr:NUDIX hydrolase YfcD [Permianibacter fluminis]NQD36125.1 NUDIX hydrolase YfcD [Permianibacter fluminis]
MSATELVQLVDDCNRPIATVPRHVMRTHKLLHRATYIIVVNKNGELCVQHRSKNKDYCPGMLDLAAGGVVTAGEPYLLSARRELQEELGIDAPLTELGEFYTGGDDGGRAYGRAWLCQWDGPITAQAEEIDAIEWLTPADILSHRKMQATPDSLLALRLWLEKPRAPVCAAGAVLADGQQQWQLLELAPSRLLDDTLWLVAGRDGRKQLLTENFLRSFISDGLFVRPRFRSLSGDMA